MLTTAETNAIRDTYKALAADSKGFVSRAQQRDLIGLVARTIDSKGISVCEAPTAVGKTIGYLVPAVVLAIMREQRVVVSTATVVLQNQLIQNDLPRVLRAAKKVLGRSATASIMKGRGRFVCPIKLDAKTSTRQLFSDEDDASDALGSLSDAFAAGLWSGDFDDAPVSLTRADIVAVANDRSSCAGKSCPSYAQCPYTLATDKVRAARIVVTNHDMLLRMLSATENTILPSLDESVVVFDEAHHLPAKATSSLQFEFVLKAQWLTQAVEAAKKIDPGTADGIRRKYLHFDRASTRLAEKLKVCAGTSRLLQFHGDLPGDIAIPAGEMKDALTALHDFWRLIADTESKSKRAINVYESMRLRSIVKRLSEAAAALEAFLDPDVESKCARWAERTEAGWSIKCSPFESGKILRRALWGKVGAGIMVSATLTATGSFDPMLIQLGVYGDKRLLSPLALSSPLDYTRSKIVVPKLRGAPNHAEMHTLDIVELFESKAIDYDEGGVLAIFSSKRQMNAVAERLAPLLGDALLVQHTRGPNDLLKSHEIRIAAGQRSVLFGLQSFGEGLDLPGRLCTTLVIAKIPFPAADDPVLRAASENLRAKGHEPFSLLVLPAANIALKQNVGRLVRRDGDAGTVYILDSRIVTASYGRQLLKTLPIAVSPTPS